jgi:hypothetical protein
MTIRIKSVLLFTAASAMITFSLPAFSGPKISAVNPVATRGRVNCAANGALIYEANCVDRVVTIRDRLNGSTRDLGFRTVNGRSAMDRHVCERIAPRPGQSICWNNGVITF